MEVRSKLSLLAVGCMLAISFEAQGQSRCPVEVLSVNARAVSAISGTALMINYRNATPKSINEIDLNARFGPHSQPVLLFVRHSIDAGMSATDQWGDRTWLSAPFSLGNVTVGIQKVTYSDGTEWSDNGKNQCTLSSDETAHVPLGVDERSSIPVAGGPQPAAEQNGHSFHATVRANAATTGLSAEQKLTLIRTGNASLCNIRTYPRGASIAVDGKRVGETPLSIVLLKTDISRAIDIYLSGFKIVHRTIVPTGTTIQIVVTLEPLSFNN